MKMVKLDNYYKEEQRTRIKLSILSYGLAIIGWIIVCFGCWMLLNDNSFSFIVIALAMVAVLWSGRFSQQLDNMNNDVDFYLKETKKKRSNK